MPSVKFFRTGDPPRIVVPVRADVEDNIEPSTLDSVQLQAFASAVRRKERWYMKLLQQKDLAEKWAREALAEPEHPDVVSVLQELKAEARRICILDHTIQLTSPHLPDRLIDFSPIKASVEKADAYLRTSKYGISTPRLYEVVGAYFADDVVPEVLHRELVRELDALAAMEPKDFHPGTGGKVQDLIHPSLYPYMAGVTPLRSTVEPPPTTEDGNFTTCVMQKHAWRDEEVVVSSPFAWIPTLFTMSDDGKDVSIEDYINGLGSREQYPILFGLLEQLFKIVMPMLERTMEFNFGPVGPNLSMKRFYERLDYARFGEVTMEGWVSMKERQEKEKWDQEEREKRGAEDMDQKRAAEKAKYYCGELRDVSPRPSAWAGNKRKVVVKAANYILEPGQEYTGTWHIEGMPHERIVASAIYYYERDPTIVDAGLYLRRKRDGYRDWPSNESANRDMFYIYVPPPNQEGDESPDEDEGDCVSNVPSDYGSDAQMGDLPAYLNIGVMPTINEQDKHGTGRIITFPNWVQHRVMSVFNDPFANSTAIRKILCFFLVDDSDESDSLEFPGFSYENMQGMRVLTTSDVPSQARACNLPTLGVLLPSICRQLTHGRRTLPSELVEIILFEVRSDIEFGITREQAEIRRRALMEDRKVQMKDVNGLWEVEYSLCEH